MNEATTTTMSDWSKDEQEFAEVIIDVVKNKHAKHERKYQEGKYECVPLVNIHFGIVRTLTKGFAGIGDSDSNTGVSCLQEIAKIQGKPNENLLTTAQRMLDLFENIGEIKKYSEGIYRLHEDGLIYQHLAEKLASTP
jgi:hypothetical protein